MLSAFYRTCNPDAFRPPRLRIWLRRLIWAWEDSPLFQAVTVAIVGFPTVYALLWLVLAIA